MRRQQLPRKKRLRPRQRFLKRPPGIQALEEIQQKSEGLRGSLEAWAAAHGLSRYEKILDGAEIETGWAKAVEAALSGRIPAYLTENLDSAGILAQDTPPGTVRDRVP